MAKEELMESSEVVEQVKPAAIARVMVIVRRFPDHMTLMGEPVMLMPLDSAANSLYKSSFMQEWIEEKIKDHLERGGEFTCKSASGGPKNVYKIAAPDEIMTLAKAGKLESSKVGASSEKKSRKSGLTYVFTLPEKGKKRDELWKQLQNQGRVILEIIEDSGETTLTVEMLQTILEAGRERLKTKQDVLKLFRFHLTNYYKSDKLGIVEVVEPSGAETSESDDE